MALDRDEQRFGYSLALEAGDIVFDAHGALKPVAGKRNLLQALTLRVETPFGSDRFNTSYGLDAQQVFTGAHSVRMIKDLIRMHLVRTLSTDPRVREVREILFSDDPALLARQPDRDPAQARDDRHRRFWEVVVTIETVTGDVATLPVTVGS
jgi:hypothetical protein